MTAVSDVFRVGVWGRGTLVCEERRRSGVDVEGREGSIASEGRMGVEPAVWRVRSVGRGRSGDEAVDSPSSQGLGVSGVSISGKPFGVVGVRGGGPSDVYDAIGVEGFDRSRVEGLRLMFMGGDVALRVEERRLLGLASSPTPSAPS